MLTDMIPVDILQEIQDAFSEYTGMAALITDANGTPVTRGSGFTRFCMEMTRMSKEGAKKCELCDREGALRSMRTGRAAVYSCHAGLTDYAAPILLNGGFIGSFLGGQVRTESIDEEYIRRKAEEYHIDPDEYVKEAQAINEMEREQIDKAALFLQRLAGVFSKLAYRSYQTISRSKELETNVKNQTDFMTWVSSELKQNVSEIYSYLSTEGENDGSSDKSQKKVYGLMGRTLELGSIVEDNLDYANIKNGDFKLWETIYSIRNAAKIKIAEYSDAIEANGNELVLSVDEDVPQKLVGDPVRIGAAVGKLIENSNSRTRNGHIRVDISTHKNTYCFDLIVRVSDDGELLDSEQTEGLRRNLLNGGSFELANDGPDETGFILAGYYINAMCGSVELDSEPGRGTGFVVTIPQIEAKEGN